MRRLPGQAGRACLHILHVAATVALTVALIGGVALGGLAWRLGRGPIALPWLKARIVAAADRAVAPNGVGPKGIQPGGVPPGRIAIGRVSLAWEGFHNGLGVPLVLDLRQVTLTDAAGAGRVTLPRAALALSVPALLRLRLAPSRIALDGATLVLRRRRDGAIGFGLGATGGPGQRTAAAVLAELARPPAGRTAPARFGLLSQLRALAIRHATVLLIDDSSGQVWRAPDSALTLVRAPDGGVIGQATLAVPMGPRAIARLAVTAHLPSGGGPTSVAVTLAPLDPSALADAAPFLAPLRAVAASVRGQAGFVIGADGQPRRMRLRLTAGPGALHFAGGAVPILGATLRAAATAHTITVDALRLHLPGGAPGARPTVLRLRGTLAQAPDGALTAAFALGFDQAEFAALPGLWPPRLAAAARGWVVKNITRGQARDGSFTFGLSAGPGFAHPVVFEAAGQLTGTGLAVHWLRPIPPLLDGHAVLRMVTPDVMDIVVDGGRQAMAPGAPTGLVVDHGLVRITGLTQHDQVARITAQVGGPLAAAIALLKLPKLKLLATHPLPLHDPAGAATAALRLVIPLSKHLKLAQVVATATAHATGVRLVRVAAGRDLDGAALHLVVGTDGLTLDGQGRWAGIPITLQGRMAFHPAALGVEQVLTARGTTDAAGLAAAGFAPPAGMLSGTLRVSAVVTERQGGAGDVALRADLAGAALHLPVLTWTKPVGTPAEASLDLPLISDRVVGTAPVSLRGTGLDVSGTLVFADGSLRAARFPRLRVGGSDLAVTLARPDAGPLAVTVRGAVLDLARRFAPRPSGGKIAPPVPPGAAKPAPAQPGPAWSLDADIGQMRLAGGVGLTGLRVTGLNDGTMWTRLAATATEAGGKPLAFSLALQAARGDRRLTLTAGDAGVLARGLGLPVRITGGSLDLTGSYAPGAAGALSGTATLQDFRLRDAPAVARVLQAVTLYGVLELMQGSGLGVTRLVAPFQWGGGVLRLHGARAFSPSLGATAEGTIDLAQHRVDLRGTIVPAYFFNSLLGRLPIVGRLFSPEQGGGLFAASYALRGSTRDPTVTVDPLTALTPGFLRGLFGLF